MAAAIGAGLPITEPTCNMVVTSAGEPLKWRSSPWPESCIPVPKGGRGQDGCFNQSAHQT
ncbi:MAG: hypothetical protein R2874_15930 [Desulfobacterales bacterium]